MGELKEFTLKDIYTDLIMGQSPDSSTYNDRSIGMPFVQGNADMEGEYPKIRIHTSDPKKLSEIDDILLSVRAPVGDLFKNNIGNIAIGRGICAIRFSNKSLSQYIYQYFNWDKTQFIKLQQGTTFTEIGKREVRNLKVNMPTDEKEIEFIATILSEVDVAIKATENSIKAAEKVKRSLMQNLFTGKLKPDGTWRKVDEFYKDEKFGNVPVGWVYGKLGKLVSKITDGEHLSPDIQDKGEYIVSAEDVFEDGVHFENVKYVLGKDCDKFRKRCDPDFGDIVVVSRGASIGRTCKVQTTNLFCMMGSVILIKPDQDILINDYISLYLKTNEAWKELRRLSGSSAQQAIYLAHLKKMRIMYPTDVVEQKNISQSFEILDSTLFSKKIKIQSLSRLKKSLMQNLLTGKVQLSQELIEKLSKERLAV